MRFVQCILFAMVMLVATPAFAAVGPAPAPFSSPAPFAGPVVADSELAVAYGAHAMPFRMSDDLSFASLRQTAAIGTTIRDLWLIDVASPLIAANVRAAGG